MFLLSTFFYPNVKDNKPLGVHFFYVTKYLYVITQHIIGSNKKNIFQNPKFYVIFKFKIYVSDHFINVLKYSFLQPKKKKKKRKKKRKKEKEKE